MLDETKESMTRELKTQDQRAKRSPDHEELFALVNRPSRYIGGEWNSLRRPESFRRNAVGICLCFPDLYETGFANTGIEILYQTVNRRSDAYAERAYSPDQDLADLLRKYRMPFFSLESRSAIAGFDIVGFSLPYELCYTNILDILELSGIPVRSESRGEKDPLVIGGGPCSVNPEPIADFFDAVVIGDGEDVIGEIISAVRDHKRRPERRRSELLLRLAGIPGVYVPSLYDVRYGSDGSVSEVVPKFEGVPAQVSYSRVSLEEKSDGSPSFPIAPVVPFVQTVHDRLNVEIQRGCPWRCRFCQAGFTYRPYRERTKDELVRIIEQGLKNTGYDAVTLAGLSAADHTEIVPLLQDLSERLSPRRISIGLPSTRADRFTLALVELLYTVRRQSMTFAPEAGTERMRRVIRKELQESEIRETLKRAWEHGWKNVKLYFMYGLPTETQDDLEGIARLVRSSRKDNPGLSLTLTLSPFVPRPHTPYQWLPQDRLETLKVKLAFLRKNLPAQIRFHGLDQIVLEGVLSRGDRRCSLLLETAWRNGARFDEWSEKFQPAIWEKAFESTGLSAEFYCYRERGANEVFPWDHIQGGPEKRALWNDLQTALRQATEPVPENPHLKKHPAVSPGKKIVLVPERTVQRLRFRVGRRGSVRFLSHLEQIEMIRRALRRAQVPVAFTSGFHPQMKVSFGPAISVGYESDCEYFDVELTRRFEIEQAFRSISAEMPEGYNVLKVSRIPLFFPSLESLLNRVDYEVFVPRDLLDASSGVRHFDAPKDYFWQDGLVFEKVKKKKRGRGESVERIALKTLVLNAEWKEASGGGRSLLLSLKFGPGRNVKPERLAGMFLGLAQEDLSRLLVGRKSFMVEKPDGFVVEP